MFSLIEPVPNIKSSIVTSIPRHTYLLQLARTIHASTYGTSRTILRRWSDVGGATFADIPTSLE